MDYEGAAGCEPSMPMTGSGLKKRTLSAATGQEGNGESETDFAANPYDTYRVPATPTALAQDSQSIHPITRIRRKLDDGFGQRGL